MLRRITLVAGIFALLGVAVLAWVIGGFGFPDGHLTELERAYAALWAWARWPAALAGAALVAMGARPPRSRGWAIGALVVLALLTALLIGSVLVLPGRLEDGGGG